MIFSRFQTPKYNLSAMNKPQKCTLRYEGGTLSLNVAGQSAQILKDFKLPQVLTVQPWLKWDPRSRSYRALACHYPKLLALLKQEGIAVNDQVLEPVPFPAPDSEAVQQLLEGLRPYQREALDRWLLDGQGRGVVVLPTGAGKTHIALGAIAQLRCAAFVVVPTLDLVDQWQKALSRFGVPVGELTGREKRVEPLTVATYDSAYIHADKFGNKFPLVVFDEVHHLPAPGYRHIAEFFASPYRLGLTATYEREDGLHEALPELLGGVVFELYPEELAGSYLAPYVLERLYVELSPEEQEAYEAAWAVFRRYVRKRKIRLRRPQDFEKLVLRSGLDPEAWEAVRARHRAVQIAFNARGKLRLLGELLEKHRGDRILIFTRFNELVYRISEEFLIPALTHRTEKAERQQVLEAFRRGEYPTVVTSQVLDEGVDVPEANVGIVLSGTGSPREFVQRLGRLLRPREGKQAVLYEIITRETGEERTASRRKKKLTQPKPKSKGKGES
jgi:superfamily II DNA or RNA helicase